MLKSCFHLKPENFSSTGTQTSSVAPGYTVDSYTTIAPRFMWRPTVSELPIRGWKSGRRASSIGVGTATTMKSASASAAPSVVQLSSVAARSCSEDTSPVGSSKRR